MAGEGNSVINYEIQSERIQSELEGTHRVWTHAVLLLTLTLTFQPKTVPLVGYPKVIPYTKFEHFEIIRFWVVLRLLLWKMHYWPSDLDLWPFNPKFMSLLVHPKVISNTRFEYFWIIRFRVILRTTERQTDRQTDGLENPTHANRDKNLRYHLNENG